MNCSSRRVSAKCFIHSQHRGFTMVELMFTVAILAILASVAIPSYREFIANQRIKSGSFDIVAMLTLTRSEAIKRNATVTATPVNNDWAQGWIVATDIPTAGTIISRQNGMQGLSVTCMQGGAVIACNSLSYDSNGRSGNAQSIQISNLAITNPSVRCVNVDPSGRPNSKKGNCQ